MNECSHGRYCDCFDLENTLEKEVTILEKALKEIRDGMATGLTTGQVRHIINTAIPNPTKEALDLLGEDNV